MTPVAKRQRIDDPVVDDVRHPSKHHLLGSSFEYDQQVRLVNLPAYPGLEGLIATIVGADEDKQRFHVLLKSTGVIKRVRAANVEKVLTGSLVELRGLVSALGLNGQECECLEFDSAMQRYNVLLPTGNTKKVKPDNLRYIKNLNEKIFKLSEIRKTVPNKEFWKDGTLMPPLVIPARLFRDWFRISNRQMRNKLLDGKAVPVNRLENNSIVFNISIERDSICPLISDVSDDTMKAIIELGNKLEVHFSDKQVYFLFPPCFIENFDLPTVRKCIIASYPFAIASCAASIVVNTAGASAAGSSTSTDSADSSESGDRMITTPWQRMDVYISKMLEVPVFVSGRINGSTKPRISFSANATVAERVKALSDRVMIVKLPKPTNTTSVKSSVDTKQAGHNVESIQVYEGVSAEKLIWKTNCIHDLEQGLLSPIDFNKPHRIFLL